MVCGRSIPCGPSRGLNHLEDRTNRSPSNLRCSAAPATGPLEYEAPGAVLHDLGAISAEGLTVLLAGVELSSAKEGRLSKTDATASSLARGWLAGSASRRNNRNGDGKKWN